MSNRLRLSLAFLMVGSALWIAAGVAVATESTPRTDRAREGGTFRMNISTTDVQSLDPAINYEAYGGQLILATCARLLIYADLPAKAGTRLVPEVAASMPRISKDGRTYTFRVRSGFRFNTGAPVTARSFERAFIRAAHPKMASPGINFMQDIVGVPAFSSGKAKRIRGITVSGNTLTIRLTRPSVDILSRVALTFFCAVPQTLPIDADGVKLPPSAGPYYFASRVPGRLIVMRENPYYRGPRPHRVDRIEVNVNTDQKASMLQIEKGERDYDSIGVPAATAARFGRMFGVNRRGGRFRVNATVSVDYIALNTQRPAFRDVTVRKAVNYAIDRRAVTRQLGPYAGRPTDQILPPNMPGFRDANIYPLDKPNLARARALMRGRRISATLWSYIDPTATNQLEIVKQNLRAIGINVTVRQFQFDVLINKLDERPPQYDMLMIGWLADYIDPFDFINILLYGKSIRPKQNQNLAFFNSPRFDARMEAASRMRGQPRLKAYGDLDVDIMRQAAPWIPLENRTQREFLSERVGCYVAQGAYGFLDLAAVCLE